MGARGIEPLTSSVSRIIGASCLPEETLRPAETLHPTHVMGSHAGRVSTESITNHLGLAGPRGAPPSQSSGGACGTDSSVAGGHVLRDC